MISYKETLEFLFNQLPMYQRVGKAAYKVDLHNTVKLMDQLGNPHHGQNFIHVAGTNGKGSVSHFISSILQEAGFNVGLYTSPHLVDFRERIRVNGEMISEQRVVEFVEQHKDSVEETQPSFFEWTFALALDEFRSMKVDLSVIEVGLGGRLDSTNVIDPLISVITNIGHDHQQFLGDTLEKIALEKAGIIKQGRPVIIGDMQPDLIELMRGIAKERQAVLIESQNLSLPEELMEMRPAYKRRNALTAAVTTGTLFSLLDIPLDDELIAKGVQSVQENTGLTGRYLVVSETPKTICDTAHNPEGVQALLEDLSKEAAESVHVVWGMVEDKDVGEVIGLLPKSWNYYLCEPSIPRKMKVDNLESHFEDAGLTHINCGNVEGAHEAAAKAANKDDLIFIGGSTFVVADFLSQLNNS